MADTQIGRLPKPRLRGLLMEQMKRNGKIAFGLVTIAGLLVYVRNRRRKQKYLDFYKCYNPEADFQRMVKVGVFQCITPEGCIVKHE